MLCKATLLACLCCSALSLSAGTAIGQQAELKQGESKSAPETAAKSPQLRPLVLGDDIAIDVTSRGVAYQGNTIHLVSISKIEFSLDEEKLTAKAKATLLTFDEAPYRAHAAVFDEAGTLLGTAAADCATQRVWLGKYLMTWQDLTFDFGQSKTYSGAKFFSVAITDHEIKTPDQWQQDDADGAR